MLKLSMIYFILFVPLFAFAQLGIGTNLPNATLDVNGDVNVRNQIYLGGNESSIGNPGVSGQIIVSNGTNPASWQDVKIPNGISNLVLSSKYVNDDLVGVTLQDGPTGVYVENSDITVDWLVISGLTTSFEVKKTTNKVNFSAQTVAQRSNSDIASYACAVFVDEKLRAVRTEAISTTAGGYRVYNMNITLSNLSVGTHVAKFACRGRNLNNTGSLMVGGVLNATYLTPGMAKSILKTIILEPL